MAVIPSHTFSYLLIILWADGRPLLARRSITYIRLFLTMKVDHTRSYTKVEMAEPPINWIAVLLNAVGHDLGVGSGR